MAISESLIGKPYCLGGQGSSGFDCFTVIIEYLRKRGIEIPENESFSGVSLNDYKEKYLDNKDIINIAAKYLSKKLIEITPPRAFAGDILMLERNGQVFFAIDSGNGNIITANEKLGTTVFKKDNYRVIKAWALQPQ